MVVAVEDVAVVVAVEDVGVVAVVFGVGHAGAHQDEAKLRSSHDAQT